MSTALAIASVTAVLKDLLNNGLIDHDVGASVGEVIVSTLPPDRIDALDAQKKSRLNLFMYQVTPNQGWRNTELPSRNGNGDRVSNPPLALDLHYLLTAYGAEELHSEILLGYGMQLLHETPVLTRDAIRRSLTPPSPVGAGGDLPPALAALFTSELAEQVEQIKIAPSALSTEEISRMWSAFQAKYRPTAVYQASVVLIQSRGSVRSALPVRARKVKVVPFKQPIIQTINSRATPADPIVSGQPILEGFQLVLVGFDLRGEETQVLVGGNLVPPDQTTVVSDTQIIATIPATTPAGVNGAQVIHQTLLGSPPAPHRGVESNVAAFVLQPRIETIGIANVRSSGNLRSADLNLKVKPAITDTQRVVLFLNQFLPLASPPPDVDVIPDSYSFVAPTRHPLSPPSSPPGPSENITIPISEVKTGNYLVRIQVDGAESPLGVNSAGQYVSPLLTLV